MMDADRGRIWQVDFFRGVAVVGMVIYHFLFDLEFIFQLPIGVYRMPLSLLARTVASIFILIVGVSSAIKFERINELRSFANEKKKQGWRFLGSCPKKEALDLRKFKFPDKCIIIFGSESRGLSSEMECICQDFIFIPMVGMTESYNVSVAAALVMYKVFEQKGTSLRLRGTETIRKV